MSVISVVRKYIIKDLTEVIENYYKAEYFGCWDDIVKDDVDFYWALQDACLGGHLEMAKLLCHRIIKEELEVFNTEHYLAEACNGNNIDVVKLIYRKSLSHYDGMDSPNNCWDWALHHSCENGNREIVDFLLENVGNIQLNMNYGLEGACCSGNRELIDLMISKGANNWHYGLEGACKGGHMEIVKEMVQRGINWDTLDSEYCIRWACIKGNVSLAQYLLKYISMDDITTDILSIATREGHIPLTEYLISLGFNDIRTAFGEACLQGTLNTVKWMLNNLNMSDAICWNGFEYAVDYNNIHIVKYMVKNGIINVRGINLNNFPYDRHPKIYEYLSSLQ